MLRKADQMCMKDTRHALTSLQMHTRRRVDPTTEDFISRCIHARATHQDEGEWMHKTIEEKNIRSGAGDACKSPTDRQRQGFQLIIAPAQWRLGKGEFLFGSVVVLRCGSVFLFRLPV